MSEDLRTLAETRIREARVLLDATEPSGAYYLAGYAVECGLKAVITRGLVAYTLPEFLRKTFTHDLNELVRLANLDRTLQTEMNANASFRAYWLVAKDWKESSRYRVWKHRAAAEMVQAVEDSSDGVLRWIQAQW